MTMRAWVSTLGILLATACASSEVVVFEELFQEELAEGWHWLRERPEDWRLVDGGLELRARPGVAETVTTALLRPAPSLEAGPLIFEVTVTFLSEPTEQYEQAGLVWYDDGEPVFKLVHELVDGELFMIPGRVPTTSSTVTLRLIVGEGRFTAQFRESPEDSFQTVEEGNLATGKNSQISLQTYHGPEAGEHWMRFTDFRILR